MPLKFTPATPMEYVPFDFEGHIDASCSEKFGHYSFYNEWKQHWVNVFNKLDAGVKTYIERHPGSNPVMERLKGFPLYPLARYEVYYYELITDHGTFTFHFNVEAMDAFKGKLGVPLEMINEKDLYIDPQTPYYERKLQDKRLPFFVRIAGAKESFICADGNKRIKARMENGERRFRGYVFYADHINRLRLFFSELEFQFYIFLFEVEFMNGNMEEDPSEKNVLSITQFFLQANAGK